MKSWMRYNLKYGCGVMAVVVIAACLLSSCAARSAMEYAKEPGQIALIAPVNEGMLADAVRQGADAAAKEFGVELTYVDMESNADGAVQLEAALRALDNGASVILIDPASTEVITKLADRAADLKVPIITLNDEFMVKGITGSIAADSEEAGNQAGEAMAELLDGKGTVALLGSERGELGSTKRENGIRKALANFYGLRLISGAECGSVRMTCRQAAKSLIDERVDGIIALEEHAALAVAEEAKRRGIDGKLKVVAFGNQIELLEKLQDGIIQKTVVQNGFSTGYLGVAHADALLRGDRVSSEIRLDTKLIGSDNMFWMDNQKLLFPFVK